MPPSLDVRSNCSIAMWSYHGMLLAEQCSRLQSCSAFAVQEQYLLSGDRSDAQELLERPGIRLEVFKLDKSTLEHENTSQTSQT